MVGIASGSSTRRRRARARQPQRARRHAAATPGCRPGRRACCGRWAAGRRGTAPSTAGGEPMPTQRDQQHEQRQRRDGLQQARDADDDAAEARAARGDDAQRDGDGDRGQQRQRHHRRVLDGAARDGRQHALARGRAVTAPPTCAVRKSAATCALGDVIQLGARVERDHGGVVEAPFQACRSPRPRRARASRGRRGRRTAPRTRRRSGDRRRARAGRSARISASVV